MLRNKVGLAEGPPEPDLKADPKPYPLRASSRGVPIILSPRGKVQKFCQDAPEKVPPEQISG